MKLTRRLNAASGAQGASVYSDASGRPFGSPYNTSFDKRDGDFAKWSALTRQNFLNMHHNYQPWYGAKENSVTLDGSWFPSGIVEPYFEAVDYAVTDSKVLIFGFMHDFYTSDTGKAWIYSINYTQANPTTSIENIDRFSQTAKMVVGIVATNKATGAMSYDILDWNIGHPSPQKFQLEVSVIGAMTNLRWLSKTMAVADNGNLSTLVYGYTRLPGGGMQAIVGHATYVGGTPKFIISAVQKNGAIFKGAALGTGLRMVHLGNVRQTNEAPILDDDQELYFIPMENEDDTTFSIVSARKPTTALHTDLNIPEINWRVRSAPVKNPGLENISCRSRMIRVPTSVSSRQDQVTRINVDGGLEFFCRQGNEHHTNKVSFGFDFKPTHARAGVLPNYWTGASSENKARTNTGWILPDHGYSGFRDAFGESSAICYVKIPDMYVVGEDSEYLLRAYYSIGTGPFDLFYERRSPVGVFDVFGGFGAV